MREWSVSMKLSVSAMAVRPSFCQGKSALKKKLGCPDLMILFTNTVSHKMVVSALQEAKKNQIPVARVHTSSAAALHNVLEEYAGKE